MANLLGMVLLMVAMGVAHAAAVDVAALAREWPDAYDLRGTKTEPTWVEAVRLVRAGDVFVLEGGGLPDDEQTVEAVQVSAEGAIKHLACPQHRDCANARPMLGFLAAAELLAALRRGATPVATTQYYGDQRIFCLAAEAFGAVDAIVEPCFDVDTGAVLAQRLRLDGSFGGPTLDTATIRYVRPPAAAPPLPRETNSQPEKQ